MQEVKHTIEVGTLTFWEKAVGLTFNPSWDERVNREKTICAELIDMLGLPPGWEVFVDEKCTSYSCIQCNNRS